MMDLTALTAMLAGLGPWGIVAGAVVTIVIQRLRARLTPKPVEPVDPSQPPVEPSKTPILDALLAFIRAKLAKRSEPQVFASAVAPDIDISAEDADRILQSL